MTFYNELKVFLSGKKTYGVAIVAIVYAVSSVLTGNMTWPQAFGWFIASGGAASLRAAISKVEQWLPYLEEVMRALNNTTTSTPTQPTPPNV